MARPLRIALILSATDVYSHRISAGIGTFAENHEPWDFYLHVGRPANLKAIAGWPADGIITNIVDGGLDRVLARSGLPTVAITNRRPRGPLPRVIADDAAVGRLAAAHLLDRGFDHFGYIGHADPQHGGSFIRGNAFAEAVRQAGGTWAARRDLPVRGGRTWESAQAQLAAWLGSLPKPLGLFAYTDHEAWPAAQACRRLGVAIPEEVAILGVTDDPLVTRLARPALSSVSLALEKLGYEAARLLDRLARGRPAPAVVMIPPESVVCRQSTDTLAINDPDVLAAVRFIRQNAGRPLRLDWICEAAIASRRSLQRKMRSVLGRSVRQEVRRARLERAEQMLSGTELAVGEVARRCGFRYLGHFSRIFSQEKGITPSAYSARHRLRP